MSNIEHFIRQHHSEFDDIEPKPGHVQRFEARLYVDSTGSTLSINRRLLLKIAAIILLLITISVFIFDLKTHSVRLRLGIEVASTELPSEVKDVIQYYDRLAIHQMNEIDKLTGPDQKAKDLNIDARRELQSLDNNTTALKQAFSENHNDERIIAALIQNQQMKERVTKTILTQINQSIK